MVKATGCIYYRFGSERRLWREIRLEGIDGLLVTELKIRIAHDSSLVREFARRTNLVLTYFDENESESPQPLEDTDFVSTGKRLIVNRVAWAPAKPIYHEAKSTIESGPLEESKKLPLFPRSLLCRLCGHPMSDPVLLNCSAKCSSSGCRSCITSAVQGYVLKSEPATKTVLVFLSQRVNCPLCKRGLVSVIVADQRMRLLLERLDYKDFIIPEINLVKGDSSTRTKPPSWEYYADIPKHYVMCIDYSLVELMVKKMILPVCIESMIAAKVSCYQYALSQDPNVLPSMGEVFVLLISYVGAGSSISALGLLRIGEEVKDDTEFVKQTKAHTAYKFQWVHRSKEPTLLPPRRQPLYSYLGAKRCPPVALNTKNEVMWRYRNDLMIEVGVKKKAFEALFESIYSRKCVALQKEARIRSRNWVEAMFPRGPPAMYITQEGRVVSAEERTAVDVVDTGNPYLGYLALLPYLSESQFLEIRECQRRLKEEFLLQLTLKVTCHFPKEKGEQVLARAYRNVWERHIHYNFPKIKGPPAEEKE